MPGMTQAGYTPPKKQPPQKRPPKAPDVKPHKKKKRSKKKRVSAAAIVSLAVFLLAVLAGAGTVHVYMQTQPYLNTFMPGTMLAGYPLGGATMEDAQGLLGRLAEERFGSWQFTFEHEQQSYTLTAQDLAFNVDTAATLEPLWAAGREGGMLTRYLAMLRMRNEPVIMQPVITYDLAAADMLLETICADIEQDAVDAEMTFHPGSATPFRFTDEVVGLALDTAPLRAQVEAAAEALASGSARIEPQEIEPQVYRAELENNISLRVRMTVLLTGGEAAIANARVAAAALHGLRIEAGDELSFNEAVGARTAERGYVPAAEPAYGLNAAGVGGGICQVSTALYRAALLGGMDVKERSAAVRPVDYCEMGQEAAVSDQGLDLVIFNQTEAALFVTTRVYPDEKDTLLEIQLIGEPLEARYALSSAVTETGLIEEPAYVRDREGLYATYSDERVPVSEAQMGYEAVVTRTVSGEEGEILSVQEISHNVYEAIPPAIYVGIQEREE